jgi:hypothetical protein
MRDCIVAEDQYFSKQTITDAVPGAQFDVWAANTKIHAT